MHLHAGQLAKDDVVVLVEVEHVDSCHLAGGAAGPGGAVEPHHLGEGAVGVLGGGPQVAAPGADVRLVGPAGEHGDQGAGESGQHEAAGRPGEEDPLPAELLEVDGEGPHAALGGVGVLLLGTRVRGCPLGPGARRERGL